jgi:hypothetical protein
MEFLWKFRVQVLNAKIRACATLPLGEHADDRHSRCDTHGYLTGMAPGMDWRERRVSSSEALTCALESIMWDAQLGMHTEQAYRNADDST